MSTEEQDAKYAARLEAITAHVARSVGAEALVKFSAYELGEDELPLDNLDEIAFSGRCKFVTPAGLWRENAYESNVISDPTWLEVAKLANDMIAVTGDNHHIYLEGIERGGLEGDVTVLDFVMGS